MQTLQMVSLQSDRDLNDILNSHKSSDHSTAVKKPNTNFDFQIEFIDTQSTEEKESLAETGQNEPIVDVHVAKLKSKTEPRKTVARTKRGGKRRCGEDKISCEMCGKLVAPKLIEYHLNAHNGWLHIILWILFFVVKKVTQK